MEKLINKRRVGDLLSLAISPSSIRADGTLTSPRTFGVYRIAGNPSGTKLYRFGNHPIRQIELVNEFGGASLEALFLERPLAEELARRLNAQV